LPSEYFSPLRLFNVDFIKWSPLATGFLARPLSQYGQSVRTQVDLAHGSRFPTGKSASDQEIIRRVAGIARDRGWSMSTVALAWLNRRVTSPVIGFNTVERMDEALQALGKELTREEERYLEEPYRAKDIQGHS
jgi:aryl-alcohol dehydrogenase-like predicted oxidoreductase